MKIYTRTGDTGETGLLGGDRVAKDHPRVAAFGALDELNAAVGWAAANVANAEIRGWLGLLQHDLFAIGAVLATPPPQEGGSAPKRVPPVPEGRIAEMESWMDGADRELPTLRHFVLPGGARGGAALHLARTVCRRAERAVVRLSAADPVEGSVLAYLNRLSDLLFTLARLENHRAGIIDVEWLQDR
jgi:cob(I)alamin adenosyltransferase